MLNIFVRYYKANFIYFLFNRQSVSQILKKPFFLDKDT
ncbi:hypothetical protein CHCC14600_2833 [Bacillus licheniformis]|nr:hypothetical protein CHCC14600_2833 [Bacillus licheniformis]